MIMVEFAEIAENIKHGTNSVDLKILDHDILLIVMNAGTKEKENTDLKHEMLRTENIN
jgi:hypothetical protein